MDLSAIRDGIADRLEQSDTLLAVYPTAPDKVVVPSAAVLPGEPFVEFHATGEGLAGQQTKVNLDVVLFAGRFDSAAAQTTIDGLITDVHALLEGDQTLDGASEVVYSGEAGNYGVVTVAGVQLLGCVLPVEVYAR